jgi:diguanylate cyclase (GGDEF)-like protein
MEPVQSIRSDAVYPALCYFLRLTALGLNHHSLVLVARLGSFKPAVLSLGGLSHAVLAATVQCLPEQQEDSTPPGSRSAPLTLAPGRYPGPESPPFPATKLLIGQIQEAGLGANLILYLPDLELQQISPQALNLMQTLSQQLLFSLRLGQRHRQLQKTQQSHRPVLESGVNAPFSTPVIPLGPASRRGLRSEDGLDWVALCSELQSCLSFKQLRQLLETYLPLLLPQAVARLILLGKANHQFSVVAQWGASTAMFDLGTACRFPLDTPPAVESDGGRVCHQCQAATAACQDVTCIVLGVIAQKAYILQLFLPATVTLEADQNSQIRHLSQQLQAVMQRLQLFETLQTKALQDPLTGLQNRRYMQTMLESLCLNSSANFQISVILIDIDHFKRVNDTYGHQAGDMVLKDVSILLKGHVRSKDVVCRYGGEEFCMVLLDTTNDVALKRAEKIRRAVKYLRVFVAGQPLAPLTVSLGVAHFPTHGKTPETLIARADKALYWAKNHGRDQAVSFDHLAATPATLP